MVGIFLTLVLTIYLGANRLFKNSLSDEIKDGSQLMVKVLSIFMACYLFLFQIPFQSLLLQGFICGEEQSFEASAIKDMECGSSISNALTVVSAFLIVIYVIFLYMQNYLYNSTNLESDLPWGSLDTDLSNMRAMWKLFLSAAFMFDKAGNYSPYTRLAAFGIGMVISVKRLTSPVVLVESVFLANSFYDLCCS